MMRASRPRRFADPSTRPTVALLIALLIAVLTTLLTALPTRLPAQEADNTRATVGRAIRATRAPPPA